MAKNLSLILIVLVELLHRSSENYSYNEEPVLDIFFNGDIPEEASELNNYRIKEGKFSPPLPEALMTTMELIEYHNYTGEEHAVITEDGFVILIQRIPFGRLQKNSHQQPVLIQHGFLCTSSCWLLNLPEQNLPYILAEEGFDVWLGNVRGSVYGSKHLYLNQSQSRYWKFSFHEMAIYDLAAIVDFILEKTKFDKLFYIGHSMGGTMIFSMLSSKPEYNEKMKRVFALAPAVYMRHMKSPIFPYLVIMEIYIKFFGIDALFTEDILVWLHSIQHSLTKSPFIKLDVQLFASIFGRNLKQLNISRIPVYFYHSPTTTSSQTFLHLMQMIHTGNFSLYNYEDTERNLQKYGQAYPPPYDLSKIDSPIVLFSSNNDLVIDCEDVAFLATKIKNLVKDIIVSDCDYGHPDFMWAINAKDVVYNKLLNLMKS